MKIPRQKTIAATDEWERGFFASEFTHAAGVQKRSRHPGGLLEMWHSLQGQEKFPLRYLVKTKETLLQFVNAHDHNYRNIAHEE
jgi:hypothetical protein